MSTFEFVERTHSKTLDNTRSGVLYGAEKAKTSGTLLLLSLPTTANPTSGLTSTASWVETYFEVFHTKLTMHDVIPDLPSVPHTPHFNPPKPHGHAVRGHQGPPVVKRDFVFATTPVQLGMVGQGNPPMIQSILDRIKVDSATADDVMFKMTWTNPEVRLCTAPLLNKL